VSLDHRGRFDEDQIRAKVIKPLVDSGWIEVPNGVTSTGRGGKSGPIRPSAKLIGIPIDAILPDFDQIVPADLRAKIDLSRSEVRRLLESRQTYDRGLGLELLALKMILDIGLEPRVFRLRSRDTAHAEVDLTAEGKNLLFSRWNFQCKCITGRVSLGDVAKEVGLAIYSKAHVVAVVTTSDFSSEAFAYAREITQATHLQFLLVNGTVVRNYLDKGARVRTRGSKPEYDSGSEGDSGQEDRRTPIVAGRNAAPVLQPSEHDLDTATAPVAAFVVSDGLEPRPPTWDAWLDALGLRGIPEPVGVVTAVAEQPSRLGQIVEQCGHTGVVADLSGGHEEAERTAVCVGQAMELRVHATFGATNQAPEIPFLTRRLDAVRCAFRYVASVMTVFGSASAAAKPSIMRRNTPISPHRFQRL